VLDLFDDTAGGGDQLARLRDTLDTQLRERRAASYPVTDVLIYYIGHGYTDDQGQLSLLVRRSRRGLEAETGIKAADLARTLRLAAPQQRRSIILDCCFSEAAARTFIGMGGDLNQQVAATALNDLKDDQPARGTILLCSSPAGQVSMGAPNAERTLFTGSVLDVLQQGAERLPGFLSFADLRDETFNRMVASFGANAPRPVLHQVNAAHGDLTRAPAFPNRASQARERAEQDRRRQEAEAEQRDNAEAESKRLAEEEERHKREAQVELERALAERQEKERLRIEQEASHPAENKEPGHARPSQPRTLWPQLRTGLGVGTIIGIVVLFLWLVHPPSTSTPITKALGVATALSAEQERALKPKAIFHECTNCPEMIVVPAGSFTMGSPASEPGRNPTHEGPQHKVTIAGQFAVGRFALTFDEWDACVAGGGCNGYKPFDEGLGRGRRPVINVSWDDARTYIVWLSNKTGKAYRLLSDAEYEYATRAGTTTIFPWGNDIGANNANCNSCGSQWDGKQTAPVGSFPANRFGLYDMVGNVNEWTEDCYYDSYKGAPADGSAWISDGCSKRVFRGGSWFGIPAHVRSASRSWALSGDRIVVPLGFRVGRTLLTP
jgi:formylglycine-generating enzyme required for sulfatase activity